MLTTNYQMGLGFDVADEDLTPILQQPQADIVGPVVRNYSAGGGINEQGGVTCYHFTHINSEVEYQALLAQFNLMDNDSSNVTITAKNNRLVMTKYNAIAQVPEGNQDIKWSNFFPRDIAIYFVDLEEAA